MLSARSFFAPPAPHAAKSQRSEASARCAACTTRRTPPCASACAVTPRRRPGNPAKGLAQFSGPCPPHGTGRAPRPCAVRQRFSKGNQRGCGGRMRCRPLPTFFWIAGGKPKLGGITGLTEYFPRIRKAYLIGEGGGRIRRHLGRPRAARNQRDARCRGGQRRAPMLRRQALPIPWCCCRPPALRSTSTAISKSAAPSSATSSPRCRGVEAGGVIIPGQVPTRRR